MNSLSWLILLINIFENFKGVLWFFIIGSSIVTACMLFTHFIIGNSEDDDWHLKHFKRTLKFMILPIVLIIVSIFVPNSRTVYLIAASEVGERVIQNERVQGLFDPSIDILKNYITLENEKIARELREFRDKSQKK